MTRLQAAWQQLAPEQRLAGAASLGLFLTMFLPWYQQNAVVSVGRGEPLVSRDLNAFAVFSFVEAAVLLVAAAVLCLLFARAERRTFHLPGSDGTIVLIGGAWAALLLIWRLFDKPGIAGKGVAANVGVQWGIFFALAAAGLLAYAGSRMRAARRPEAPRLRRLPRSEAETTVTKSPRASGAAVPETTPQAEQPSELDPPARGRYPPTPHASTPSTAGGRALRSGRKVTPRESEQLTFEETSSPPDPYTQEEPPSGEA